MSDQISSRLRGMSKAIEKMLALGPKLRRKGLRKASRQAMNIVRDDARSRAKRLDDPATAEKIYRNLVTHESARQGKREGGTVMRVGIRGGARDMSAYGEIRTGRSGKENPGGDTFHWRFLEFGTQDNPAAPFMRPALSTNTNAVTERFATVFTQEMDAALRESS